MNIEEAIKILKQEPDFSLNYYNRENAIDVLLTAYEKEKGENVKLRLQDIPLIEGELKAYKDRVNELKQELEKEKEKNKELEENYSSAHEDINWFCENYIHKDKIIAKVMEIKDRPIKYEFITATQGKLNTIIDIESLLEKE